MKIKYLAVAISKRILILLFTLSMSNLAHGQWLNASRLYDLNTWSHQPGFFEWYETLANTPAGSHYGSGIQMVLGSDNRFGTQLAMPTFDPNLYYRRKNNEQWDTWAKIWSSANLNTLNVDFSAKNLNGNGVITLINKDLASATWDNLKFWANGMGSYIESTGDEAGLRIKSHTGNKILLMSNVGIGTENPQETLSVNGKIRAHEIKVEATGWPDYVFEEGYQIETLEKLESYIKAHKHLPEIPSAKEVESNGVALGEMNKLLLKKVEELTLHLIEKDKQLKQQEQKNADYENRLQQLEKNKN